MLRHKHVVSLYGICLHNSNLGIVMEYCSHGNLLHYLKNNKTSITWNKKLQLTLEVASGLHYLHTAHVLYRDLKVDNALVDEDGHVKLVDFGLSKIVSLAANAEQRTRCIGTSWYIAPEVTKGEPYDAKCDIFSLGILLYQILTELPPYGYDAPPDIHEKVAQYPTCRPAVQEYQQHYSDYVRLMQQCWDHDPHKRPTAYQVGTVLQNMLTEK